MSQSRNLASAIAQTLESKKNCASNGNEEFFDTWSEKLEQLCESLPSGSGFDNGTEFDEERSNDTKLVFTTGFHHMNQHGYYIAWTYHTVTAKAAFTGMHITVSGRQENDIKDYIAQVFYNALTSTVDEECV